MGTSSSIRFAVVVCLSLWCVTTSATSELETFQALQADERNAEWILTSGFLVMFMQAGFAMLEAGTVSSKHVQNILFKNFIDMCIGAVMFFLTGYALAYGDSVGGLFGSTHFALSDIKITDYPNWFFQYAFSSAAATIVSGSMAGRCKIEAYFIYSILITALVYPCVAHWGWSEEGWLYKMDFVDFAGSGIVHLTGGSIGLVGAWVIGPRLDRFTVNADGSYGEPRYVPPSNTLIQTLGVFILMFGWYGFNCGSTLEVAGGGVYVAARVATTTTLSAAAATVVAIIIGKSTLDHFDLGLILNGSLAGLVSITAGTAVVSPLSAVIIGAIGCLVYAISSNLMLTLHIDDPLDAFSIHGACGIWALLATGIFQPDTTIEKFGVQAVGAVAIMGWAVVWAFLIFKGCQLLVGLRVSTEVEIAGIDKYEHGGSARNTSISWSLDDIIEKRSFRRSLMEFMKKRYSEESLEFLLECRELFSLMDMECRLDFLHEDLEMMPDTIVIDGAAWKRICDIMEKYIVVGSAKEININSGLNKRIVNCYNGVPRSVITESSLSFLKATFSSKAKSLKQVPSSRSSGSMIPCSSVAPETPQMYECDSAVRTIDVAEVNNSYDEVSDKANSNQPDDSPPPVCSVTVTTAPVDAPPCPADSPCPGNISKEFLVNMVEAYSEIHRLVFENFYGKFCQTSVFTKASRRYASLRHHGDE